MYNAHEIEEAFKPHLDHNERIIWAGKPKKGFSIGVKSLSLLFPIVFMIIFFTFFFGPMQGAGSDFMLFSLPFIGVPLFMLGKPIYQYIKTKPIFYALTEYRIITIMGYRGANVHSIDLGNFSGVDYKQKKDGSGNIIFQVRNAPNVSDLGQQDPNNFVRIENVREAYQKIKSHPYFR